MFPAISPAVLIFPRRPCLDESTLGEAGQGKYLRTPSCCETTITAASPQCFLGPRPRASVEWLLFKSFLQGLTSLNLGFCEGIK